MSKSTGKPRKRHDPPEEDALTNALSLSMQGATLKRITTVMELLTDRDTCLQIAEIVGTGGSINTVEMAIGLPSGMLKQWLHIGKTDREDSPYNALYRFYLAAASEARRAAEASLLMKNPAGWLDRCDPLMQLEEASKEADTLEGKAKQKETDSHVTYREFND